MVAMAKLALSSFIFSLLLLCFFSGESLAKVSVRQTWCVAKPSSSISSLTDNIKHACHDMNNKDCNKIKERNHCFNPNSTFHHASFAMNAYYHNQGGHYYDCDFNNSGLIAITNPSYPCNVDHCDCFYEGTNAYVDMKTTGKWCVAKPTTSDEILQKNIELACTHVDCRRLLNAGGDCFKPATLLNIASVTMNLYYQASGKTLTSCDFWGTGLLVVTDPSYETCKYEYRH